MTPIPYVGAKHVWIPWMTIVLVECGGQFTEVEAVVVMTQDDNDTPAAADNDDYNTDNDDETKIVRLRWW